MKWYAWHTRKENFAPFQYFPLWFLPPFQRSPCLAKLYERRRASRSQWSFFYSPLLSPLPYFSRCHTVTAGGNTKSTRDVIRQPRVASVPKISRSSADDNRFSGTSFPPHVLPHVRSSAVVCDTPLLTTLAIIKGASTKRGMSGRKGRGRSLRPHFHV